MSILWRLGGKGVKTGKWRGSPQGLIQLAYPRGARTGSHRLAFTQLASGVHCQLPRYSWLTESLRPGGAKNGGCKNMTTTGIPLEGGEVNRGGRRGKDNMVHGCR